MKDLEDVGCVCRRMAGRQGCAVAESVRWLQVLVCMVDTLDLYFYLAWKTTWLHYVVYEAHQGLAQVRLFQEQQSQEMSHIFDLVDIHALQQ